MKSQTLYTLLKENKYSFFSGVPCSYFTSLYDHILEDKTGLYVAAPHEGLATSIAAGAVLAGKKAAVIIQNSGLGNTINPVTSLCIPYGIPLLFFVSGRAYQIDDEPQHRIMGTRMHAMLQTLGMSVYDLSENGEELVRSDREISETKKPVALVVKKGLLEQDKEEKQHRKGSISSSSPIYTETNSERMSRTTALQTIAQYTNACAVITTTGTSSREFFTLADRAGHFYMQGSMGHAAGIGLGVALNTPKKVVVVDGDGALLMHMGILSTIGYHQPKNFVHLVIDNEAYESTGNQYTTPVDFAQVAASCSYTFSAYCSTQQSLEKLLQKVLSMDGPSLIHIKVGPSDKKEVPRITNALSQPELAQRFMDFLRK